MFAAYSPDILKNKDRQIKEAIENAKRLAGELCAQPAPTYDSFMKPLEKAGAEISRLFFPVGHLNSVCNSKETQELYAACIPLLSDYSTWFSQNADIMKAVKKIAEADDLSTSRRKSVEDTLRSFRLGGVDLPADKKQRVKEISLALSELGNAFFQNLLNATAAYELEIIDPADMEGIPESDLAGMKTENGWKLTLQMPVYIAYMTHGRNREIREKLYRAYCTRAPENGEVIENTMRLRHELAQLTGFSGYAEYSLASKDAESPADVLKLLETLLERVKKPAEKEIEELKAFFGQELESHDLMFASEQYKKHLYGFDEELYRPYFEKNNVIDGMIRFLGEVFSLSFERVEAPVWHKSVAVYDISRKGHGFARLYMDMETRKEKRDGAWMNDWVTRHTEDGKIIPATAVIAANFPAAKDGRPSLLRHRDVVTLFHEMGHALHHICSEVDEADVSGINGVEWDAVEFPSQFLELFAYEEDVLAIFARHYQTGEIIPAEMVDKLKEVRSYHAALVILRQVELGMFDMLIHRKPCTEAEVQKILDTVRAKTSLIQQPAYNKFQNGFSHIFSGGYAAGYYSYKWAERMSADAFMEFRKHGIFNRELADRYFDIILKNGGSRRAMELYKEFIGREPGIDAMLELEGIKA
ncbi:M3 family peptidase [Geovibrio thiophilus]|uniref:oligopeptidase A n=1 Tax=Geovibrio thiophilus TaxID=139438 RepID=A0A3R5UZT2_9BACT|nr:M3 family metallopeptidase [Geovibrio thiophilus]QAR33734.1 M3 family peptidase [Geovibrio thiophilus]